MGTAEAAEAFGFHPDTLRHYLAEDRALPVNPYRVGRRGHWRFDRSAVERWTGGAR
ncbi:helix-turn-helix domain-containing protein [Microbacterium sp. BWR-S6Y]|uniref:helix-turn-helix domain-containing protein n=1 Tax=Microbacterium sp. BWR-S6Y TaxID=3232073 RepID=UPI0035291DA3